MDYENLQIEKLTHNDCPFHHQLVSDSRVMEMITGRPLNEEEATDKYNRILLSNAVHPNFGYYKITEAQSGNFIGIAKLEIKEKNSTEAELGYLILPEFWGQGIAGNVAKRLLAIARQETNLGTVYAIIDPENIASRKILEKNGFKSKVYSVFDGLPGELLELNLRT